MKIICFLLFFIVNLGIMGKLNITKESLLEKYNKEISDLADECDWVTTISDQMVCAVVVFILVRERENCFISSEALYHEYSSEVKKLNLTNEEWCEKYGIPEIIGIIYEILEKHAE